MRWWWGFRRKIERRGFLCLAREQHDALVNAIAIFVALKGNAEIYFPSWRQIRILEDCPSLPCCVATFFLRSYVLYVPTVRSACLYVVHNLLTNFALFFVFFPARCNIKDSTSVNFKIILKVYFDINLRKISCRVSDILLVIYRFILKIKADK
jgi:hypothetical protein